MVLFMALQKGPQGQILIISFLNKNHSPLPADIRSHSFSFVIPLLFICCHSLLTVVLLVLTRCHSLSLAVPLVMNHFTSHCYSFLLDLPFVCLFKNDQRQRNERNFLNKMLCNGSLNKSLQFLITYLSTML